MRKTRDYDGTPAAKTTLRHSAALARLLFLTRAEAEAKHQYHLDKLRKNAAKMHREGKSEADIESWWVRAEAAATYTVPAWLARDLDRHHCRANVEKGWGATAVWGFNGADEAEIAHWCMYVEQRDAENRKTDDKAFAALASILTGEAVTV
ncbi:MAG: hypothetical protein AAGG38_10860 [Planctomycetota bacterium]